MGRQAEKSQVQGRQEEKVLAPEKILAGLMKAHKRLEKVLKEAPKNALKKARK